MRRAGDEGYSISSVQEGPERFDVYRVGRKTAYVSANFTAWNDVSILTESFRSWSEPEGQALSEYEFESAKERLKRYFECWGGKVSFDDTPLLTQDEVTERMKSSGMSRQY